MAYAKVVEMLGENLASFLELAKKLLIDWEVDPKRLLHMLQNLRKVDLIGLIEGTHEIKKKDSVQRFKVWKTIKIGTLKNVDEFHEAFKKDGLEISDWADDILSKPAFTISSFEEEIQLVNVSVADLGFNNGACYLDIYAKATEEFGLKFCNSEVGPQLRLQYKNQPDGEWLWVAMGPITDSGNRPSILSLSNDVNDGFGLCLSGDYGHYGRIWNAHIHFVFCI